jgi:hypothetical protein
VTTLVLGVELRSDRFELLDLEGLDLDNRASSPRRESVRRTSA